MKVRRNKLSKLLYSLLIGCDIAITGPLSSTIFLNTSSKIHHSYTSTLKPGDGITNATAFFQGNAIGQISYEVNDVAKTIAITGASNLSVTNPSLRSTVDVGTGVAYQLISIEADAFDNRNYNISMSGFLTIPTSIQRIEKNAFANQTKINDVIILANNIAIDPNAFDTNNQITTLNIFTSAEGFVTDRSFLNFIHLKSIYIDASEYTLYTEDERNRLSLTSNAAYSSDTQKDASKIFTTTSVTGEITCAYDANNQYIVLGVPSTSSIVGENLTFNHSVVAIGTNAFAAQGNFSGFLKFSSSINTIYELAFQNDPITGISLDQISSPTVVCDEAFSSLEHITSLYIPHEKYDEYHKYLAIWGFSTDTIQKYTYHESHDASILFDIPSNNSITGDFVFKYSDDGSIEVVCGTNVSGNYFSFNKSVSQILTQAFADNPCMTGFINIPSTIKVVNDNIFSGISIDAICLNWTSFDDVNLNPSSFSSMTINDNSVLIPNNTTNLYQSASMGFGTNINYYESSSNLNDYINGDDVAGQIYTTPIAGNDNVRIIKGLNIVGSNLSFTPIVQEIEAAAFLDQTGITDSLSFSNNLKTIDENAFNGCISLQDVTLPSSITTIGTNVFDNCNLKCIKLQWPEKTYWANIDQDLLKNLPSNCMCIIPWGLSDTYSNQFTDFASHPLGEYTTIPSNVFKDSDLTGYFEVEKQSSDLKNDDKFELINVSNINGRIGEFNDNITGIGDNVFNHQSSLTGFADINKNISYLGSYAFASTGINTVYLSSSLNDDNVGTNVFQNCTNLSQINFDSNCQYISDFMFSGCSSLSDVTIPKNILEINKYAFQNCNHLKTLNLNWSRDDLKKLEISNTWLDGCDNIDTINVPLGTVSDYVDYVNNWGLDNLTITDGQTSYKIDPRGNYQLALIFGLSLGVPFLTGAFICGIYAIRKFCVVKIGDENEK